MSENYQNSSSDGNQFPDGLRVLAVDDNIVCLKILVTLLEQCRYKVTATTNGFQALEMLRKNRENFDIVITDVNMLDMDGFELLDIIGLEMDIPVIMTSVNDDRSKVLKGITHGARDYLLKPVRILEIKNIWQHVVRKKLFDQSFEKEKIVEKNEPPLKSDMERSKEIEEESFNEQGDSSSHKKPRLNWTSELHTKFLNAIHQLGTADKAVPKKILEIMKEPGLTRENVASHLQKYRKMLRKNDVTTDQQSKSNHDSYGIGWRPSNSAICSDNQGHSLGIVDSSLEVNGHPEAENLDMSNSSSMYSNSLFKPGEKQDGLIQQTLQSPQLAMHARMHLAGQAGVPTPPFWAPPSDFNGLRFPTYFSGQTLPDEFMEVSSQFPTYGMSSETCLTSFAISNSFASPTSLNGNWNQSVLGSVPDSFPVQHDPMFSTDDDLTAMVKQFNSNGPPKL